MTRLFLVFAIQAYVAGAAVGAAAPALGCFIVLRRLSLVGDSLGHAVLPGLCLGFMVTWTKNPWWLFAGALAAARDALANGTLQKRARPADVPYTMKLRVKSS